MADAFFHQGLTIECEDRLALLRIEGTVIPVERHPNGYGLRQRLDVNATSLVELGRRYIAAAPEYQGRAQMREQHLALLNQGRNVWNDWRSREPQIRPILYEATLGEDVHIRDFSEFDFSWAGLSEAKLPGADFTGANFFQAHLGRAQFPEATLNSAHFCRADLYETNLAGAFLIGANLQGAQLSKTILAGAHLIGCPVYGMAVWDVDLKGAEQKNLIVRYRYGGEEPRSGAGTETEITVDDLQVAQFIYLMLDNPRIKIVLEGSMKRSVLILGRFADDDRKAVLDGLRERLRQLGWVPIIFDFPGPEKKDLIQTITILASLSRFVIGDITDPRSVALEFQAILGSNTIPIVPIIFGDHEIFSLLGSLQSRQPPCVMDVVRYPSRPVLLEQLERIVQMALDREPLIASQIQTTPRSIELTG